MSAQATPGIAQRVDLHLHTTASDGVLEPAALIAAVAAGGVDLCAVTDHDSVDGLDAAGVAAGALGLKLVPGVELSTLWSGRTLHVLGLGMDPASPILTALLAQLGDVRRARARAIAARLDRAGAPGSAILAELAQTSIVTRTHFARQLVARGHARDVGAAFSRWLARGQPGYVSAEWPELDVAIDTIRAAGGVAVLAHPLRYKLSAGQRRTLVKEFARLGGTGLEVITGGQSPTQTETAVGLCLRAGLEGSQGSDCHDPSLPWQRPGRLAKLAPAIVPVWHRWQADLVAAPASTV